MKPVTAVVVTYRSARTIGQTLDAARRCHDAQLLDIVVVDNASPDSTLALLARETGWLRVMTNSANLGFGKACNVGLDQVQSPFTLFLNPDAVLEPPALRTMLEFLERFPQAGIAGPAIIEGEGGVVELQDTGKRPTPWSIARNAIPWLGGKPLSYLIEPGSPPRKTQWVCGAVLLARTDLLRRLGGFDPRFFLYWEEMDLCKRAEAAGYETWALGTAVARHVGGASSAADDTRVAGCIARHYFQSRYYYMVKHHGRMAAAAAESVEFLSLGARSLVDLVRGRGMRRLLPRLQARPFSQPEEAS